MSFSLRGFDGNFKRFLLIIALFTLSNSSDAFLLLRAQSAGVSVATIPLLWAMLHVSKVMSSLVGGDLSDRLGRRRLIVSGWILYAAVYIGFAFVTNAISVWVLFLIYGIYFGLAEGAEKALVADLVRPEQRGTAYGLYNLAFGITVLPASLLMGALWIWWGPATAFLVSGGTGRNCGRTDALDGESTSTSSARLKGSLRPLNLTKGQRSAFDRREKEYVKTFSIDLNNFCLFETLEAQHKGQILMLKRLSDA